MAAKRYTTFLDETNPKMLNNIYKVDYIDYRKRIAKKLAPVFGGFLVIIIFIALKPKFNLLFALIMFLIFLIWGIIEFYSTKSFIHQIQFQNNQISIFGYDINKSWKKTYALENVEIKIKAVTISRSRYEYVLEIITESNNYEINDLLNWDYYELIKIFKNFKELKHEKIILDDKLRLQNMEKKAKGLSLIDNFLGRD